MDNDLISRSALLDAMPKNDEIFSFEVRKVICNAPAVDAVEVVRCMDCKMLGPYLRSGKYVYCDRTCMIVREEDYCSYGERKMDSEVEG